MGVIYKLKPQIKDYILQEKKKEPNLSCRKLTSLMLEKFQLKLSKSTINTFIKQANLSMPVGRRRKKRRSILEASGSGAIILQAADYLIGGTHYITEAVKNRLNLPSSEPLLAKTEALLFAHLINPQAKPDYGLWSLLKYKFTLEEIISYLADLQRVTTLPADILQAISRIFQELRCVKLDLSDHSTLYLDGQLHTVWSTLHIPYDFSTTLYNVKSYINKYFREDKPILLFMAPGYDTPTPEFFDFLSSLEAEGKTIQKLTLYGNKLEEIEAIPLTQAHKRFFVFGLWPWQFAAHRRVKTIGEFRPFYSNPLKQNFYIADLEIELSQTNVNKIVTLKGCALKRGPQDKIRLVILSNLSSAGTIAEELANLYLSHWPNLEEAFQDFSRKIELFTYAVSSQHFFSTENLGLNRESAYGVDTLFNHYLKALDAYVRWHFLPTGYEDKDFATTKERFYALATRLKKEKESILVTFLLPKDYPFSKDLQYALRRINEREIIFSDGKRLWFSI